MADSSESVFLFKGIKIELSRIADYSAILQQPLSIIYSFAVRVTTSFYFDIVWETGCIFA